MQRDTAPAEKRDSFLRPKKGMQQAQVLLMKMNSVDRDHLCKDDLREETQTGPREIQTSWANRRRL